MEQYLREYYKDNPKKKKVFCEKGMKSYVLTDITILDIKGDRVLFAYGVGKHMVPEEGDMPFHHLLKHYEEKETK